MTDTELRDQAELDPLIRLAALADVADPDRQVEVYPAARGAGRVCFLAPSILGEGAIGIQRVLGPGSWRLVIRLPGGTLQQASIAFEGRPRSFDFASPHYLGPPPVDLRGTAWGPPEAPPAPVAPPAPAQSGMVEQVIALAAAMRPPPPPDMTPILLALLQRPVPAAPDMAPMFAAMMQVVGAQKGPSAAEMLELARALRPEPVESPWAGILETAVPIAGPIFASYLEHKAAGEAGKGLLGTLAAVGAKLLEKVNTDDDEEADDAAEEADDAAEGAPPSPGPAPQA